MRRGFFRKTARTNIKNNYRFFVPRILTEAGLLGCFYIIITLAMDKRMEAVRGGAYIPTFMIFGTVITAILSVILMLYTNSFVMKQRKREFGLYNVLGMEKKHVGRVLFHESLQSDGIAVTLGLLFGLLFYKLCTLIICKLLHVEALAGAFELNPVTIGITLLFFGGINALTFIGNRLKIGRMKPVDLLASKHTGEREPRVRWLLLIIGILTLSAGYYLAIAVKSPLEAIFLFFVAVVLVIIGTYCLFITGITFVLKLLKKNEKYYYNRRHMPAVSGLLYRMKQNAVGMASITILACGVLMMLSTTISLYAGMEETLHDNYPQHLYLSASYSEAKEDGTLEIHSLTEELKELVLETAADMDLEVEAADRQSFLECTYLLRGRELISAADRNGLDISDACEVTFITEEQYTYLTGSKLGLSEGQAAVAVMSVGTGSDVFDFGKELTVAGITYETALIPRFPIASRMHNTIRAYGVVVPGEEDIQRIFEDQYETYMDDASAMSDRLAVTFKDEERIMEEGPAFIKELLSRLDVLTEEKIGEGADLGYSSDSIWRARDDQYGLNGTLFFLGLILGFVFLFATVLIIYYKQISEGYEDRERFQIMKKVGMSNREVKRCIGTQIILVFFLPLLVAAVHIGFSFPMVSKLLHILLLSSNKLFIICSLIVYGVFSLIYFLIYSVTAKTYYKIVG